MIKGWRALAAPERWPPVKSRLVRAASVNEALEKCGVEPCVAAVPLKIVEAAAERGCRPPGGSIVYLVEDALDAEAPAP